MLGTTGATGEVGGRLARRLADRGERQRLIVRDRARAPRVRGAEAVEFGGYRDDEGMMRAFAGISTLFLVSAREAADRLDPHRMAVDAAVAVGVKRIVYLSFVGPAGEGRIAPVLRDDVADALAAVMTEPGHDGLTYELSGPEALTLAEITAELTRASGRKVVYENETLEEARASRAHCNAPRWELEGWITTYTAIAAGEFDRVTDHVARLTGK